MTARGTALSVRVPAVADIPALVGVLNTNLGSGLYSAVALERDLDQPTARVLAAYAEETLVGGAVSRLLEPVDVGYYERFGNTARAVFVTGPIGSIEALAVSPAARRAGVGRGLLLDSLAWCRGQGCMVAVAISWMSGASGISAPLFAVAGFTMGETIADFYLEDSLRGGWGCPVCGPGCRCAGQFVSLRLDP